MQLDNFWISNAVRQEAHQILLRDVRADDATAALAAPAPLTPENQRVIAALQHIEQCEQQRHQLADNVALSPEQAQALRTMLLNMPGEARALPVKLAQVLARLRCNPADRLLAHEVLAVYAPTAGRLGLYHLESIMEDAAFAALQPEAFAWIQQLIALGETQRRRYISRVCNYLRRQLRAAGIRAQVVGRVKHAYSYWRKLVKLAGTDNLAKLKHLSAPQINDVVAFRIIVGTRDECYQALDLAHTLWEPRLVRVKDFIARPKPNGYQSLHTTVRCLDNIDAEIQIRTAAMHQHAEYGPAMHWHYKTMGDQAAPLDRTTPASKPQPVFVFSPKGDIYELPAQATPLDFAYRVHTEIGNHCVGALVASADDQYKNQRMVPLTYQLQTGDTVAVLTNRSAHPTQAWLKLAHISIARSKITRYLKAQVVTKQADERLPARLPTKTLVSEAAPPQPVSIAQTIANVTVTGSHGLLVNLAKCCLPKLGDDIVAFISRERGAIIHCQACPNITRLPAADTQQLVEATWQ